MSQSVRGTGLGALAILSWGGLGALGASSANLPPHLVLGLCFAIAAAFGWVLGLFRHERPAPFLQRDTLIAAFLLTIYHLSYLEAFHHAAAIPVALINYLWPACLIIIGNLFFRLDAGWPGYVGAGLGFFGIALMIGGGREGMTLQSGDAIGYGLAFLGAMFWATYSNLRRGSSKDGVGEMTTICALSSAACFALTFATGEGIVSIEPRDMMVILLLGLGPAGGAFFMWDIGMRKGNAALLGILGYAAPVLSTLLMLLLGMGEATWRVGMAVILITLGGVVVQTGPSLVAMVRKTKTTV